MASNKSKTPGSIQVVVVLMLTVLAFYFGNRFGQVFDFNTISRMSTTAEVSILMPFATMELDDKGGNYYGQNKHSSNLIFCNRKLLASPMGFVCGKTGSGKGMAVKTEMTGTILSNPTDEIYIIDRAGEYTGISSRYGGVTYNFAVDSDTYLNPFDTVSVESLSPDAQLAFKIDAMLAQAGASAAEAGRDLGEEDQSIITRCVQEAFFDARQRGEQPPLLEDFYNKLLEQPEPEAKTIALRYERFVTGAQSFFNHQSNVDFKSRIVDFNLKDLPDSMLVFGLINVCEAVRNRMYFNAKRGVRTWLYVEEIILSSSTVTAMEPVSMTMSNSIRSAQRLAMHPSSTAEQSIQITCASNIRMMNMKHFAGAISTRRHTVISNTPHVSSTSATADFEKGSARMPAQPKTSLKAKSSISTTATSSRMRTDRIRRKSPQKGFGMNSGMFV